MTDLAYLHLPQGMLERHGLPDHPYPVPSAWVTAEVGAECELSFGQLLFGLQLASAATGKDWERFEPAMERLAALIARELDEEVSAIATERWGLELGAVDLGGTLVTIQRDERLIAAIARRPDGGLRAAVYRPLDAKSAAYLTGLSVNPAPEGGVCMRENNWEYALDCSAGMGNHYAAHEGKAYLSYWEMGFGNFAQGGQSPIFRPSPELVPRRGAEVAVELRVHYLLATDGTA